LDTNQDCAGASSFLFSQITTLWFLSKKSAAGTTNPLPTALTAAVFSALIDNTDTTGVKMKFINVEGGIGAPTETTKRYRGEDIVTKRLYTLEATTLTLTDATFDFLRKLSCGGYIGYLWFGTVDHIYGGYELTDGDNRIIQLDSLKGSLEFATADDAYVTGKITAVFNGLSFPRRTARFI
jgi:hypothetical protein